MRRTIWIALLTLLFSATTATAVMGPGRVDLPLIVAPKDTAGTVALYNDNERLLIDVQIAAGWRMASLEVHAGWAEDPVPTRRGYPVVEAFDHQRTYRRPVASYKLWLDFDKDLGGFRWGEPWEAERLRHVAVHAWLIETADPAAPVEAWAEAEVAFPERGWWLRYPLAHKARGHFIDSPVEGARMVTPTTDVLSDQSGGFDYFPGEQVSVYAGSQLLGTTLAYHRFSPLDFFPGADLDDPRVANMAMLLQSLDADADPKPGITLTSEVLACFEAALDRYGPIKNWGYDRLINYVVRITVENCAGKVDLRVVARDDAVANLSRSVNSRMFRKNVSKTPEQASAKAKLNVMPVWFPALKANGEPATFLEDGVMHTGIPYYDDDGAMIRIAEEAKPLVVTYTDADPFYGTSDVWAGISRDDGATWKRKNLSRSADRSSFVLDDGAGAPYYGDTRKPVFQVKENKVLAVWSSKYCRGGKPRYSIDTDDDYPYDDPYQVDDIWGAGGPQRSHDYSGDGFPEVGEIPYSCVWSARGVVVTEGMINGSPGVWGDYVPGDVVWFKPERLTSGRRDAYQIFVGAGSGAGFATAWQEDPEGIRPGNCAGPGHGWSGATASHKTEIWYSYVSMADFARVDTNFVPGGDPDHDLDEVPGRPKALVPMSLPVRITENDAVNTDNLMVELDGDGYPVVGPDGHWIPIMDDDGKHAGTHRYAYELPGLCESFYEFTNNQGVEKKVCVTAEDNLLDGDTGASRPNVFLQPYSRPDGTKSAWAIVVYEETKGLGAGEPSHDDPLLGAWDCACAAEDPDRYAPDEGKNVHYHSFDFRQPEVVDRGTIVNHPELDEASNPRYLVDEDGVLILDWQGQPQLAYHNARRPRLVQQGKGALGSSRTAALILYKEGRDGRGRPSDIKARRLVAPATGNPYAAANIVCEEWSQPPDQHACLRGARNLSSTTPLEIWVNPDADPDSNGDNQKVWKWAQTPANLTDGAEANPFEDARAHRGGIRGDFVIIGYTHTPNWGADRNGNDKHDFYVRRSFDGGVTWTADPLAEEPIEVCQTFKNPETHEEEEVCDQVGPGQFQAAHNVSQLPNNKFTVGEPRIVATPGTIKVGGVWTGKPEDKQDKKVAYLSYGTVTNPKKDPVTGVQEDGVPADLYFSFTQDRGQSYVLDEWVVNPDSDGPNAGTIVSSWFRLARGEPEQGEAQLRSTPDGSRFYAVWLEEGGGAGSDVPMRRILPKQFGPNNAP